VSTTAEYWNSEPEDSMSYLDMLNDASFLSTIGSEFTEAGSTGNYSTNHAFDTATSISSALGSIPRPENMDTHWALHDPSSNHSSGATTYNFDLMPAAAQGCSFDNVDY